MGGSTENIVNRRSSPGESDYCMGGVTECNYPTISKPSSTVPEQAAPAVLTTIRMFLQTAPTATIPTQTSSAFMLQLSRRLVKVNGDGWI